MICVEGVGIRTDNTIVAYCNLYNGPIWDDFEMTILSWWLHQRPTYSLSCNFRMLQVFVWRVAWDSTAP